MKISKKKAIELFETLKSEGLTADHVVYNTIVNGCLYHSKWDQACKYTLESFSNNVKIAYNMYKKVLEKLTFKYCDLNKNAKINYATAILKNLKEKGITIDDETYKKVSQLIYKNNSTETSSSSNEGGAIKIEMTSSTLERTFTVPLTSISSKTFLPSSLIFSTLSFGVP